MLNFKKKVIMDTKKVLVLESIAAKLDISSDELIAWANNRKDAHKQTAQASLADMVWGTKVLTQAASSLAEEAEKQTDYPKEAWCGH